MQNRQQKPLHPLSQQRQEGDVEKKEPQRQKSVWEVQPTAVQKLLERYLLMGIIIYHWTCGQKPHLIKNGRKIDCNTANHVPFVVPGLSASSSISSSPTSPTSRSQNTVTPTEHPASTRSENMSEEVQGNLSHGPAQRENPNKNDDNEEVRGNLSHDLPECTAHRSSGTVW